PDRSPTPPTRMPPCCATTSTAPPRASTACARASGAPDEVVRARLADRPGPVALPARRPARRHTGRALAQARPPVRAARVGRDRGDAPRCPAAAGAAGAGADLRQVRADPLDPA